jgi:acetoin utilization deacetylase AcuC-like enzyme
MLRAWTTARWSIPLPDGHRFPMAKYAMIRDGIVRRGLLPLDALDEPDPAPADTLTLVHTPDYVDAVFHDGLDAAALRRLGFPWRRELPGRSRRTVQGTLEAARDALERGAGINLAGGTHHAFPGHGEGFCVFNDVAVAIRALQGEGKIRRAAIVDLDVHQGNGSAAIFANDADVYTYSMHGANNYPFRKERSRVDIELEDGCDDACYLALLARHLERALTDPRPDLVIYIAGADPYAEDRLGRLRLSIEGLARRDRMVLTACRRLSLPVAVVLGGGYARDLADVVSIHVNTVSLLLETHG